MTETSVSLPELPNAKEFEEYNSAILQLGGYYIERNVIERDVEDVLELDIILTDYSETPPEMTLVEVKSGDWGFGEVFKVSGWMQYLAIPNGMFITNKEKSNMDFYREKATRLGMQLVAFPSTSDSQEALSNVLPGIAKVRGEGGASQIDVDVTTWRYSYWIERNLMRRLNHKKKSCQDKRCYQALADYCFETSSGIFFTENLVERVDKLYSAYARFPNIAAKTAHELLGKAFDDEHGELPRDVYEETFYECKYNDIHACLFVEHRARLAILKSAVDYVLHREAGIDDKAEDKKVTIFGVELSLKDSLPKSFNEGLEAISTQKYVAKYPVFWQWFMWVFGGFILKDYEELEYSVLSEKTGIPVDQIPNALDAYQRLFPVANGWLVDLHPNSSIVAMKMFPPPFMGVGVFYRRWLYLKEQYENLHALGLSGTWTYKDLAKWNNLGVQVLRE